MSLALLAAMAAAVLNPAYSNQRGFIVVSAGGGGVVGLGVGLGLSFGILGGHVGHGFDIPFVDSDDDDDDEDDDEEKNADNGMMRVW